MAKEQDRKRKLTQESLGRDSLIKRAKSSKTATSEAEPNGDGPITAERASRQSQYPESNTILSDRDPPNTSLVTPSRKTQGANHGSVLEVKQRHSKDIEANDVLLKDKKKRKKQKKEEGIPDASGHRLSQGQAGSSRQASGETMFIQTGGDGVHSWRLSRRSAGAFLDQDPVFVQDPDGNECIISANQHELLLMSLETSQVVRSHHAPDGRRITCFCLSSPSGKLLDAAYDNGELIQWDWNQSLVFSKDSQPHGEVLSMVKAPNEAGTVCSYCIVHREGIYAIYRSGDMLYETKHKLQALQVLDNAKFVVALGPSSLVLGMHHESSVTSPAEDTGSSFVWQQLPASSYPFTCFDARVTRAATKNKKRSAQAAELAVAVGNSHGQILLYSNILMMFSSQLPAPRIMHWHPEHVSTVRFSEGGTYLLSGGKETVLVFWQLATGKRSYLPHLSAEIERLVISPEGTRYALQMGDNSIVVLNSTEQKAIALFAGLQIHPQTSAKDRVIMPKLTATLHPQNPQHLLLTTSASRPKQAQDVTARPFLQTFDVRNARHVSKQALARNTVTDLNIAPGERLVIPPDVNLLAISQDGHWLATLDQWIPQASDLEHLLPRSTALGPEDLLEVQDQQQRREEVFLKFWRWQADEQTWALNTRIQAPHSPGADTNSSAGPGQVFRLAADPTSNGFVSVGQDGHVRVWRPKRRTRHGVPVEDESKEEVVKWVCQHDVAVPATFDPNGRVDSPVERMVSIDNAPAVEDATLTISEDGSLIACALLPSSLNASPVVHFISTLTGKITASKMGLATPESCLVDLGFLEQYFIALSSDAIRLWNLIEDRLQYTINIPGNDDENDEPALAIDAASGTFAVLMTGNSSDQADAIRKIQIFEPQQTQRLLEITFSNTPIAIFSSARAKNYTIIFDDATIRTLSQVNSAARLTSGDAIEQQSDSLDEQNSEMEPSWTSLGVNLNGEDVEMADEDTLAADRDLGLAVQEQDDRPVVQPEQLASLLDAGQATSMLPVKDMFRAVVELYARKPQTVAQNVDAMEIEP